MSYIVKISVLKLKIHKISHTLKMCLRVWSEEVGIENMLKWRMNRGVTGLRPPPGGAQAAQIVTSWISKKGFKIELKNVFRKTQILYIAKTIRCFSWINIKIVCSAKKKVKKQQRPDFHSEYNILLRIFFHTVKAFLYD